jgi:hypothetical protein
MWVRAIDFSCVFVVCCWFSLQIQGLRQAQGGQRRRQAQAGAHPLLRVPVSPPYPPFACPDLRAYSPIFFRVSGISLWTGCVVMVHGGRSEFRPKYLEEHPEVKGVAAVSLPHPPLPNPVARF